jgi:glycosyltransferase involved in cell wall biosynthesis
MPHTISDNTPHHLVILTQGLAPYRLELYDQTLKALGDHWTGAMFYAQDTQRDHQWQHLFSRPWRFLSRHAPSKKAPAWILKLLKKLRIIKDPFLMPALGACELVFAVRPDLLWIGEYSTYTIPSLLWARANHVPVMVGTEMGRGMPRDKFSWLSEIKHRLMGNLVQGQVASAPWARNPCCASISKVVLSPHAIDTTVYVVDDSHKDTVPAFLYVGNLLHRKGVDLWLTACAQLRLETTIPFKLRFVGGGDMDWARGLTSKYKLEDIVEFVGFLEGQPLIHEYQRASAFVLPSRYDTYGAVAHEAAACGLPLILSRYAGCSEVLLEPGRNGFIVDPTVPADFVAAMKCLLEDETGREQMGRRSREIAEMWCVRKCGSKVAQLIESILD